MTVSTPRLITSLVFVAVLLPLWIANVLQVVADKLVPNRPRLGSLQKEFHQGLTMIATCQLITETISAISITGAPLVVAMFAFDTVVLFGVWLVLRCDCSIFLTRALLTRDSQHHVAAR